MRLYEIGVVASWVYGLRFGLWFVVQVGAGVLISQRPLRSLRDRGAICQLADGRRIALDARGAVGELAHRRTRHGIGFGDRIAAGVLISKC